MEGLGVVDLGEVGIMRKFEDLVWFRLPEDLASGEGLEDFRRWERNLERKSWVAWEESPPWRLMNLEESILFS